MTRPCCATCAFWTPPPESKRPAPGRYVVGSCALGGPLPREGCSDTHASEFCEDHKAKEEK